MGGCASKPKDSHVEPLDENPTSPKQIPKNVDGDLSVENKVNSVEKQVVENEHEEEKQKGENEHEEEEQKVENEHKEEPLPVSSPMPEAATPAEDSTAKEQSTVIDLVSNITGSNSDAPQDLKKDSDDPQKVSEIIHDEEKTGVVTETADQPKKDIDQAQGSQTTETATKGTEIEPEMQKLGVHGEGPSPNSEALKDSPTSLTSA